MFDASTLPSALAVLIANLAIGLLLAGPAFILFFLILRAGLIDLIMGTRAGWSLFLVPAAAVIGIVASLALDFKPPLAEWVVRALIVAAPPALLAMFACAPFMRALKRAAEGDQDAGALSASAALLYASVVPAAFTIVDLQAR
ncbi:MAG: hypothetical protein ACOC20_05795 [Oceanicaulis sp.]